MTGLTIRNRLAELLADLPSYALYNVAAFTMGDTWALSPIMLSANPSNKQKLMDWMKPVNHLKGSMIIVFKYLLKLEGQLIKLIILGQLGWRTSFLSIQLNGLIPMK